MDDMHIDMKPLFAWLASAMMTLIPRSNMDIILKTAIDMLTIVALALTSAYTIYRWVILVKSNNKKIIDDEDDQL